MFRLHYRALVHTSANEIMYSHSSQILKNDSSVHHLHPGAWPSYDPDAASHKRPRRLRGQCRAPSGRVRILTPALSHAFLNPSILAARPPRSKRKDTYSHPDWRLAYCSSIKARSCGTIGTSLPSSFFVVPANKRMTPERKSTWRHGERQPEVVRQSREQLFVLLALKET